MSALAKHREAHAADATLRLAAIRWMSIIETDKAANTAFRHWVWNKGKTGQHASKALREATDTPFHQSPLRD